MLAALLANGAPALDARAAGAALDVVGRSDLGANGIYAGLAVAGNCAYVGSRGDGPVTIVDISDPAHPRPAGEIPLRRSFTPREVRALPDAKWLVVLSYSLAGARGSSLDFYRWQDDCRNLAPVGKFDFGAALPHEMYLWRDPANAGRVLLFVTMFGGRLPDLSVIDASDPTAPRLLTYGLEALPGPLHSISLDPDGRRAYLADWTGGLFIADSEFAVDFPNPQLHIRTAAADAFRTAPGNVHSAVPVPGRPLVVTTDERYPPPGGAGCPYGTAHLVDVSDIGRPRATGELSVPENDPHTCANAGPGTWTSHNPTVTPNLALISWYSAGLQVFDISDASHPLALTQIRPTGRDTVGDYTLGHNQTMTWSYPVIQNGLIYVADINQGLLVLRYHGPHEEEITRLSFAEGNSNLTRQVPAPAPSASATAAPPAPAPVPSRRFGNPSPVAVALAVVIALILAGGLALRRLR